MGNYLRTLLLVTLLGIAAGAFAQPTPPNENANPEGTNDPIGGGAPIGSGLELMLLLGGAYIGKKWYSTTKEKTTKTK
ncbi:MAG: hypothetical protein K9H64_00785 [Bacteroidales bacterium]|nr:hypothetical protein [Bacteroidales bacterium]MCF8454813.1 hypothetical protein [Bacteroidales bacterium]